MNGNTIAAIAAILFLPAIATAQVKKCNYAYTCGDKKSTIVWTENNMGDKTSIAIEYDWQKTYQEIQNKDRTNTMWRFVNKSKGSDYTVRLEGKTYKVSGTLKGKSLSKTFQSKGFPWIECLPYSAQYIFSKGVKSVKYESVNPNSAELATVTASISDEVVTINGKKAKKVTLSAAGGLWKCYYFVNPDTKEFIQYRGTEGVGVPETVWTIK